MHRRKSSKEDQNVEDGSVGQRSPQSPLPQGPHINGSSENHARTRVNSTPLQPLRQPFDTPPPSAGPFRSAFASPSSPNGVGPPSPFRGTFSHSRTRSTSLVTGNARPPASPLRGSFSSRSLPLQDAPAFSFPTSSSTVPAAANGPPSPQHTRRHSRIHSRNLSVFFPRPGALPPQAIDEDGGQEIEYTGRIDEEAPVNIMPAANSGVQLRAAPVPKRLGEGFTFGGRPGAGAMPSANGTAPSSPVILSQQTRRGHHHKHSLSHNFFSFLEPGSQFQTQSSSQPASPFNNVSSLRTSPAPSDSSLTKSYSQSTNSPLLKPEPPSIPKGSLALAIVQFLLGASLWVSGQQSGSLGCTGLGYWVVFDAFGVALGHVLPAYLSLESLQSETRRPFGNARIETLMLFSQSVYLVFSSVYVCKETVEHLLLSAGEGHHHHRGDEDVDLMGIQYPNFLVFITLISLISTSLFYGNHTKLIEAAGHNLPSFTSLLRRSRSRNAHSYAPPASAVAVVLLNPFTVAPLLFSSALLMASLLLPPSQHRPFDLLLASVETVLTFSIAYPACVVLGTVLLQTSPERGLPGGRTEAFLRVMREIERHPQVLHLPAPHIWQLTPTTLSQVSASGDAPKNPLVVTLELHVRRGIDDDDILQLTRWAHDRCRGALNLGARNRANDDGAEVTVGIVKG